MTKYEMTAKEQDMLRKLIAKKRGAARREKEFWQRVDRDWQEVVRFIVEQREHEFTLYARTEIEHQRAKVAKKAAEEDAKAKQKDETAKTAPMTASADKTKGGA